MAQSPVVTFSYATWTAMFPEFANCSSAQGDAWFLLAQLLFTNNTANPAYPDGTMATLYYLLVSHLAWLNAPRDANGNPAASGIPAPPTVGRISNASEGSVSVALEWKGTGQPGEDFYNQTRYGAQFWQATAQYRTARYVAQRTFVPLSGGFRRGW